MASTSLCMHRGNDLWQVPAFLGTDTSQTAICQTVLYLEHSPTHSVVVKTDNPPEYQQPLNTYL
jgi:hypothetical protein